jgi:hypothetical protein
MTDYEQNVCKIFRDLVAQNGGASPAEVTHALREKDQLPALDTVIDVERTMRELRDRGCL